MSLLEPRQFFSGVDEAGIGLPHDRAARLAARRAFVELKTLFIEAMAEIPGHSADWLRHQVRACEEPIDLWLLRASVLEAVAHRDEATRRWRRELKRGLSTLFPQSEVASGFGALTHA